VMRDEAARHRTKTAAWKLILPRKGLGAGGVGWGIPRTRMAFGNNSSESAFLQIW
jgi:hypothetical protein